MQIKNRWGITRLVSVVVSLFVVIVVVGHGCSNEMSSNLSQGSSSESSLGESPVGTTGSNNGGMTALPNSSTVSLLYNKQLVNNLVACLGVGLPSTQTLAEWSKRQSSFSEFGYGMDVTAPMLMAITAVSGEVCNDLINVESVLPSTSRRIFNDVNFSWGLSTWTPTAVGATVRRLARSCWARNEEPDELLIIQEEVIQAMAGASSTDPKQTRNLASLVCTGVLASLSGITL